MFTAFRLAILAIATVLFCLVSSAQEMHLKTEFGGGVGAGFTVPTDRTGESLNMGWNFNLRGGLHLSPHLSTVLDFTYNRSNLNSATLALFQEPNGSVSLWSLTFNPVVRFASGDHKLQPYITAGYGLYHQNLTLTQPAIVRTLVCNRFWGYCFPAAVGVNQVVASGSTLKTGFNAGGGFDIPLGSHRAKLFTEARYHRMFTTYGSDFTYIPVTFGVHF